MYRHSLQVMCTCTLTSSNASIHSLQVVCTYAHFKGCVERIHQTPHIVRSMCIKAWVNKHAYNGEYTDILIMMTQNGNCYSSV